jgi:hypothetical protein
MFWEYSEITILQPYLFQFFSASVSVGNQIIFKCGNNGRFYFYYKIIIYHFTCLYCDILGFPW